MKQPSKEQIKERSKFLRQALLEKYDINMSHGHALDVLSKVFGFNDWNTAAALGSKVESEETSRKDKPIAMKFENVGEMKRFLEHYPDDTKLSVHEYHLPEPSSNKTNRLVDSSLEGVTSVCCLTYDYEIQSEKELRLELSTESVHRNELYRFGRSVTQSFDKKAGGRIQRSIKYFHMLNSFWNSKSIEKASKSK